MNLSNTTAIEPQDESRPSAGQLTTVIGPPTSPAETITEGSIYLEKGAHWPNFLLYESGAHVNGWAALGGVRSTLEKQLEDAGWTLFFMAGEIKVTVLGSGKETLRTALKRLITKVKAQQCNGMEIVQVTRSSFLGVPYVSVSAHPRHLQKGLVFSGRP